MEPFVFLSVPVVITIPMVNLTVTVGSQAFLSCEVYGDPAPNVTWDKGRKKVRVHVFVIAACFIVAVCSIQSIFNFFITACNF